MVIFREILVFSDPNVSYADSAHHLGGFMLSLKRVRELEKKLPGLCKKFHLHFIMTLLTPEASWP